LNQMENPLSFFDVHLSPKIIEGVDAGVFVILTKEMALLWTSYYRLDVVE